jgi:hypothetical protein
MVKKKKKRKRKKMAAHHIHQYPVYLSSYTRAHGVVGFPREEISGNTDRTNPDVLLLKEKKKINPLTAEQLAQAAVRYLSLIFDCFDCLVLVCWFDLPIESIESSRLKE